MLLIRYCLLLLRIKSFSPTVLVILKLPSLQHQNLLMVQLGKGKTLQSDHGLVYRQMSALSFSVKISLFSPFQLPLVPGYQLSPTLISRKLFYYYFFFLPQCNMVKISHSLFFFYLFILSGFFENNFFSIM